MHCNKYQSRSHLPKDKLRCTFSVNLNALINNYPNLVLRLTYLDTSVRARIDIDSKALVQIDHVRIDIDSKALVQIDHVRLTLIVKHWYR